MNMHLFKSGLIGMYSLFSFSECQCKCKAVMLWNEKRNNYTLSLSKENLISL